jgi:uncharacterized protein with PQ loop repeat
MQFIGACAMLSATILNGIGVWAQVYRNYQRKRCDGLSAIFVWALTSCSFFWAWYGLLARDWFIVFPNVLGVIGSAGLLYQLWHYRTAIETEPTAPPNT